METIMSQAKGLIAEQWALRYLQKQGLNYLVKNYSCRWGEIDLIMEEDPYLVFIEVRARNNKNFGGAAASVTFSKQKKIIKTAQWYMQVNKIQNKPVRFDVVCLDGQAPEVNWIKDAFSL